MITKEFLNLLKQNPEKELIFEYNEGEYVPMNYHITEIKNIHQQSVDCGGNVHEEYQTIVQLWISESEEEEAYMESKKALKIFEIVDRKIPLRQDTEIYFEYGFKDLRTSVYKVEAIQENEGKTIVQLFVPATVCKPKLSLNVASNGCNPQSNCC